MSSEVWQSPKMLAQAELILRSYEHWVGQPLCPPAESLLEQASTLFHAPFVVLAHGTEPDPIFCYGNEQALKLWETDLDELLRTASRTTAEPGASAERQRMLERVARYGYVDDYRGVRIGRSGRRFVIEGVTIWNLRDACARHCGQAATFSHWHYL